jgi:hypothetical protein
MYRLEAVIGHEHVLRELARSIPEAHIHGLRQDLSLLPMIWQYFHAFTVVDAPERLEGFWTAPDSFGSALAACSANGPVAYVEADYIGGHGAQVAQVWDGGRVVFGPLCQGTTKPVPAAGGAISQALRHLGVVLDRRYGRDEFDTVGLGRRRETEKWLPGRR